MKHIDVVLLGENCLRKHELAWPKPVYIDGEYSHREILQQCGLVSKRGFSTDWLLPGIESSLLVPVAIKEERVYPQFDISKDHYLLMSQLLQSAFSTIRAHDSHLCWLHDFEGIGNDLFDLNGNDSLQELARSVSIELLFYSAKFNQQRVDQGQLPITSVRVARTSGERALRQHKLCFSNIQGINHLWQQCASLQDWVSNPTVGCVLLMDSSISSLLKLETFDGLLQLLDSGRCSSIRITCQSGSVWYARNVITHMSQHMRRTMGLLF
ncbi:hypothetical protein MMH89_03170 [Candidatus Comchoanobacter bicostacola]|uniref:Uncharacterized protein n=1 Tax=Candidatus Comchoanobacter bicostacola TaxID=2919598 RepID=A0ABY5DHS2_9GAMM|nr:hypothetical protein [Candidatus Comchoanobacter bicostacola]UTC24223.1 hypothetical protein MMH89_03170 [Candidatus Comchoanobacter bicostacola]